MKLDDVAFFRIKHPAVHLDEDDWLRFEGRGADEAHQLIHYDRVFIARTDPSLLAFAVWRSPSRTPVGRIMPTYGQWRRAGIRVSKLDDAETEALTLAFAMSEDWFTYIEVSPVGGGSYRLVRTPISVFRGAYDHIATRLWAREQLPRISR